MSKIDVIKRGALFTENNFLDAEFSALLRREIDSAKQLRTPLLNIEKRIEAQEWLEGRPKAVFDIAQNLQDKLEGLISDIKPRIEEYFTIELEEPRKPYFAVYKTGEFLGSHVDSNGIASPTNDCRTRTVSLIIFLNDNKVEPEENCYSGGNLTIYGLMENGAFEKFGYPIKGETGKLVAFRSTFAHEVSQVTQGTRYVVNSGYY